MSCICDFCSDPNVGWRYPARSFLAYIIEGIAGQSVGDWTACVACHDLIEKDDRSGLAAHSIDSLIDVHPEMRCVRDDLLREMAVLHRTFFESRTGAPDRSARLRHRLAGCLRQFHAPPPLQPHDQARPRPRVARLEQSSGPHECPPKACLEGA